MPRLEQLEALLASEPNDVFLNYSLAMELAKAQRWEECLARYDRVIVLDPTYIAAHAQKGKTLIDLGRKEEARQALAAGIERAQAAGNRHAKDDMEQLLRAL